MSFVESFVLDGLYLNPIYDFEREISSLDQRIAAIHKELGLDQLPKSKEERDARGLKGPWDGLRSSVPRLNVYLREEGRAIVTGDLWKTRYSAGEAFRKLKEKLEKQGNPLSEEEIKYISPNMANVHLMIPTKWEGKYVLIAQIKGDALGGGQIHSSAVAGNVDGKYISREYADPLTQSLIDQCSDELGLDLNSIKASPWKYIINEQDTGQMAFVKIAQGVGFESVLNSYRKSVEEKVGKKKIEVAGLTPLPVSGLAIIEVEKAWKTVDKVICYFPTSEGFKEQLEQRELRPITVGVIKYLESQKNREAMLETAGF